MEIKENDPSRVFHVGEDRHIAISHQADIRLDVNEQVTFVGEAGSEYDVVRKEWGYYATPSLNGRLSGHGLRAALVMNAQDKLYIMLCETGSEESFLKYLADEQQILLHWMDTDAAALRLKSAIFGNRR